MIDLPPVPALFAALDATWPAVARHQVGPWMVRQGRGAGNRVAAATATGPVHADDIARAEVEQHKLGQPPLFMIRPGDEELDTLLAARGYRRHAPTVLRVAPIANFPPAPSLAGFPLWPPLAIVRSIWEEGGIDAARQAVMDRVQVPKVAVLARAGTGAERPSGVAFVAAAGEIAMIHAITVRTDVRRMGCGRAIMAAAAAWALGQGARWLALAVTADNTPAAGLYSVFDMAVVARYHYRIR